MADVRSERHPSARAQPSRDQEDRRSNFVVESWGELKKVEWPSQNQVIQGTVVVLVACIVVGAYLYLNDQVWKQVVSKLLLGQ
jgi:preprotein translocase SecE subunit